MDYSQYSDEELITLLREGDNKITDYLMEKYKGLVRKNAHSMFIIGADPDDLLQEGMIGLFTAIRDYDPGYGAKFITFADICVSRKMYNAVEAGSRKKHAPLNSYVSLSQSGSFTENDGSTSSDNKSAMEAIMLLSEKSPEDALIDRENAYILEQKINAALSDFERQVLNLHMTGLGYVEIARILGKDEKSADNALSRIKTKVKKIVNG